MKIRSRLGWFGLIAFLCGCLSGSLGGVSVASAQSNPHGQFDLTTFPQPYVLLMRDPAIHRELGLNDEQSKQLYAACYAQDATFWKLRGGTREQALKGLQTLTEQLQQQAGTILSKPQRQRVAQIQLQLAGFNAFLRPEVVKALNLSDDKQGTIQRGIDRFNEGFQALGKRLQQGEDRSKLELEASQLRSELRDEVTQTLTNEQKAKWQVLAGKRVNANQLGKVKFKAPELTGEGPWINSSKLSRQQLQGKVVALHFYAFQCINCKRNQPWYKDWHQELADKGLVVLGIHTPELSSERKADSVQSNAKANGLAFPIVIDNEKKNWSAWGNTMWPTTYLIDKEGFVRYWWMGELNWKEQGMQEVFKKHLNQLLIE